MKSFLAALVCAANVIGSQSIAQTPNLTLSQRIAVADDRSFEQAALQSLRAVETLLQTQYKYGIGRSMGMFIGLGRNRDLTNINPDPREADTFADMIRQFAEDMDAARTTLARSTIDTAEPFTMDLTSLWFDININGPRDELEGLDRLLARTMLTTQSRLALEFPLDPMVVRFDGADHAWLTAYTHMLSGLAEGILAFDPSPVFEDLMQGQDTLQNAPTIPYTYDVDAIAAKIAALEAETDRLQQAEKDTVARAAPLSEKINELGQQMRTATSEEERHAIRDEMAQLNDTIRSPEFNPRPYRTERSRVRAEIAALRAKLPPEHGGGTSFTLRNMVQQEALDTVYSLITALNQQPDAARIAKMRDHWRVMLAQNRLFWDALVQETDNDREWIGNPDQTSAFGITVTADMASAWQDILADAEAVLEGRLLVPHPLLPPEYGINIAAYLDNPTPIDIAAWVHGRGAYPYAAKGPKVTPANWRAFTRLTSGRAGRFALFFN